ncbi:hypothetical protein AB4K20DRAFT_1890056 [Rhizopus microsporus]|uniref:Survival Motor Neuron Gemin2-binding domain-containing protein n=1 Tax=Rhizopus microsporus TaxID=58291 RepID=A0A1X0SDY4_RHIZD|nr:hypothetical protein BCV71DRAFT_224481 [Rhizopus microsporus]
MSLNKSTSDAEIPTGTVLFAAGQMKHDEFWDDTELIEHWDKTVELYRSQYSNVKEKAETETKGKRKKKALEEDIPKKKKVRHTTIKDISQPNPTKTTTAEEDLSNLIMAWYYAGYYTALYSEQHK